MKEKKQIATELQQAIAKVEKHCAQVAKDALDKAKEILDKIKEQIDALFEAIDQGDLMKAAQILSILLGLLVAAMIVLAAWLCPVVPPCPP